MNIYIVYTVDTIQISDNNHNYKLEWHRIIQCKYYCSHVLIYNIFIIIYFSEFSIYTREKKLANYT